MQFEGAQRMVREIWGRTEMRAAEKGWSFPSQTFFILGKKSREENMLFICLLSRKSVTAGGF